MPSYSKNNGRKPLEFPSQGSDIPLYRLLVAQQELGLIKPMASEGAQWDGVWPISEIVADGDDGVWQRNYFR